MPFGYVMEHEIIFGPEWVEVRTHGKANLKGFRAFSEAVAADRRWQPGMNLLIDHSRLDVSSLATDDVSQLGQQANRDHPLITCRRCAFYVPLPIQYGIGRMWQQWRKSPAENRVMMFSDRQEAEAWLRAGID